MAKQMFILEHPLFPQTVQIPRQIINKNKLQQ